MRPAPRLLSESAAPAQPSGERRDEVTLRVGLCRFRSLHLTFCGLRASFWGCMPLFFELRAPPPFCREARAVPPSGAHSPPTRAGHAARAQTAPPLWWHLKHCNPVFACGVVAARVTPYNGVRPAAGRSAVGGWLTITALPAALCSALGGVLPPIAARVPGRAPRVQRSPALLVRFGARRRASQVGACASGSEVMRMCSCTRRAWLAKGRWSMGSR
jgi:hypothetical protein